jgi:hypothetical protein
MKHHYSLFLLKILDLRPQVSNYYTTTLIDTAEKTFWGISARASQKVLVLIAFVATTMASQTQVFLDNFNRSTLTSETPTTYSTTVTAGDGGASINSSSFLELTDDATSNANLDGIVYTSGLTQDFLSPYNQTLHSNNFPIEWTFNFRYNRTTNPSGFAAGNYGTAIILAISNEIFIGSGAGNGYAVVFGSSGTPDPIRLVKFTGGVTGTLTNIISSGTNDISALNDFVSVRVIYEPTGDNWSLFIRDDGASSWADPSTGVTNQKGSTASDNTYVLQPLTHFGFYWAYATAAGQTSQFDNFGVKMLNAITPTITISTSSLASFGAISVGSTSSTQNFTISGINLAGAIVITPPTGFEVRTGTNSFSSNPISLTQTNGSVSETAIDVRFSPGSTGSYSGNITCLSTGATARNIAVSGSGTSTDLELFITSDPSHADENHAVFFPIAGMGTGIMYGADDWNYISPKLTFYIVPIGSQSIGASEFEINWDAAKADLTVTNGNMFDFFAAQDIASGKKRVNTGASSTINISPSIGKYIAKLEFTVIQPGLNEITTTGMDFRYFSSDVQQSVQVTAHSGAIKFYLGDFASANNLTTSGDGKINFDDLIQFALAYFSESDGQPAAYKAKFDIGPTNSSGSYFAMPEPDGRIQFEDLAIFSIGYGKTAVQQLPKKNTMPVLFDVQPPAQSTEGAVKIPLTISGKDMDVRVLSVSINYPSSSLEYSGFEKCGEMNHEYCFMAAKAKNDIVTLDAAIMGSEHEGLSEGGIFAKMVFKQRLFSKNYAISILSVKARDNNNHDIQILLGDEQSFPSDVPIISALAQNYPNPFNPTTAINYQLSTVSAVKIYVYDMLGREVARLVNEIKPAGFYQVQWNTGGVPSGVYFYQMQAGSFVQTKKMVLQK